MTRKEVMKGSLGAKEHLLAVLGRIIQSEKKSRDWGMATLLEKALIVLSTMASVFPWWRRTDLSLTDK